jgi:hypothetical protein
MSQQAIHGNELSHMLGRQFTDDDAIAIGMPSAMVASIVATLAVESGLQLADAAHQLLDIPALPSRETFRKRLQALREFGSHESPAAD